MANEIERKFLVTSDAWRTGARNERYRQGYLSRQTRHTVQRTARVRIAGAKGFMTIKGERQGLTRLEFEYEIPLADAEQMLDTLCEQPQIDKTRHFVPHAGLLWEVDEFWGENTGLIVAEVELERADQAIELPNWVGEEVTEDARYYNSNLVRNPFCNWHTEYQALTERDRDWVRTFATQHWGSDVTVSRGNAFPISELPGFAARQNGVVVGLVSYRPEGALCELAVLNSLKPGAGIGTRLIELTKHAARAHGCKRLWLITTNDNTHAIRFYQRRGFVLAAVHRDAIATSRAIKPEIPLLGNDDIAIRDEIEFELML